MRKVMKYLKKSTGYIVLIVALLFLQAYCDLSLPDYTSKIVNVGIQQQGIEDGVPEKIRVSTMEQLETLMEEKERKRIKDQYEKDGEIYVLKKDVSREEREGLNQIFCKPMLVLSALTSEGEESQEIRTQMGIPEGVNPVEILNQMPEEQRKKMTEELDGKLTDMPESILSQSAVAFVRGEYEAMGEDVDGIQMRYISLSGLRMLLMALVIMLASICVTYLSARVAALMGHDMRNAVYRKVMGFSSNEYHKFSTASLITRCTNDV